MSAETPVACPRCAGGKEVTAERIQDLMQLGHPVQRWQATADHNRFLWRLIMKPLSFVSILLLACAALVYADSAYGAPSAQVVRKAGELAAKAAKNGLADDALRLAPLLMGLFGKLAGVVAVVSAGIYVRDERRRQAERIAYVVALAGGAWTAYAWLGLPFVRPRGPQPESVALSLTGLIGLLAFAAIGAGATAWIARSGSARASR